MSQKKPIYMDAHATTPMDPKVFAAMQPYFFEEFGNAGSLDHPFGQRAYHAVEAARAQISAAIGAQPEEIFFTSGTTESNNLALKGGAQMYAEKGKHIVTTVIEHHSVLDPLKSLERQGFAVTYLPVNSFGEVSVEAVAGALTAETILISVMAANNEIGTLNPIAEIGKLAKEKGIFFHTDAAQAIGKIPIDVKTMGLDLMSFSAHKMYGPKGVGALYVRQQSPRVRLAPQIEGGGQEKGIRSGTLNVPGIVGLAQALTLCCEAMATEGEKIGQLRDRLHQGILARLDEVHLNGHPQKRLPGNLNLSFGYIEAEPLIKELSEWVAVSTGSACSSATLEPSYVLPAIGVSAALAHAAIRFGLGRFNTQEEVDCVIQKVVEVVQKLRKFSPLYSIKTLL